jgi:NADP-dependent 3-hydroxy acid dehydrogenase YdfG
VDELAKELSAEGITTAGYAANVRDGDALAAALARAGDELGTIEVLEYSPIPQKEFLRPVLETTTADLAAAVEFSIHGPVTAVGQVSPGMRSLGRGALLLVNGGSGARRSPTPTVSRSCSTPSMEVRGPSGRVRAGAVRLWPVSPSRAQAVGASGLSHVVHGCFLS